MIMFLPGKRYNISIISFLLILFFSGRLYASPPGLGSPGSGHGLPGFFGGGEPIKTTPRRVGDRLYFTPACPIIAENFNQAADVNGATSDPSSVGWYLDRTNVPNAVYFAMKSHRIKAQTLGGEGVWYSQVFNISGYTGIQVDAKISSEGSFTSSEYAHLFYKLDGGPETSFGSYTGAFGTPLVTSGQMTGHTVQIVIRLYNVSAGNNDYYIEQYDVFKEVGPCTVSSISVSASASNSGVLTCTNPSTTLTASTTASGTTTYSWTGPNSFSATGASVTATTAGTYTVTGTNSAGTGTATVNVTSNTAAPGSLTATASGSLSCSVTGVTLTGSSSESDATYAWTGPNSYSNTGASVTANMAGTYTLTATNPTTGCTSSTTVAVTSNTTNPTGVTATASGPITCSSPSATLTGSSTLSGTTFAWTGPNSFTASGATATATAAGTYTLTATYPPTGCWSSVTVAVTSNTTAPANVTATASGSLSCSTTSVTLTGSSSTSGTTFAWTGPNNFTASGATAAVTAPGTYTVTATNPSTGCTATASTTVTQNLTAPANVTTSNNGPLTCNFTTATMSASSTTTSGVTYAWAGTGNAGNYSATGASVTTTIPGTFILTATYTATGCTTTAMTSVYQTLTAPGTITASNNGPLTCSASSVTLSGSSTLNTGVSYAWTGPGSFTATGTSATATVPGTYTLTATNTSSGCTATATTTVAQNITAPAGVTATASGSLSCSTTSVTLTGSSTTSGTTFAWSGPGGFTVTGATATATAAGTYTLTATNPTSGCTATATVTVTGNTTAPAGLAIAAANNVTQLTCSTNFTTLSGSSTTSGVTYSWTGPNNFTATSSAVNVFNPGTYTMTVTNPTSGCTASTSIAITQNVTPPAGVAISPSLTTLTCSNSSAVLTGTSTTTGVSYAWTGPSSFTGTGTTVTAVTPGEYILTVTNPTNGCTTSTAATVNANFAPPAGVTAINNGPITCNNPTVTLTGNSSTANVSYSWTGPSNFTASGATATTSVAGTYTLTVTNPVNGCSTIANTVVAQNTTTPAGLTIGSSTGGSILTCTSPNITLTASSSTSGVNYSWSGPNSFTGSLASVSVTNPGTYNVTATNSSNGCTSGTSVIISQNITPPSGLLMTSNPTTAVLTCATSSIAFNANASGSRVGYSWTGPGGFTFNGQTTNISVPGTYSVTATDSTNGCSSTASTTVTQNITPPVAVTIASATGTTIINCTNPTITITGNANPQNVNYSWSGPNNYSSANATTSVTAPGTYTVTATKTDNGCSKTANVSIALDTAHPAAVTTSSVPANATLTCSTPNVILTGSSNTTGVTYGWTGPNSFSASSASATVTAPGSYVLTVTNPNNGCSTAATANAVTQNIAVPLGVTANVSNKISCFTTSVTITGNSTTSGATYAWTGPGGFTSAAQSASATLGGVYNLTVTNPADGCTATKQLTVVADTATPAGVTATNSGPITCTVSTVTLTGNSTTSNVTYSWSGPNGFFDPEQVSTTATDSGTYVLTVTSSGNGCSTNASTNVSANLTGCSSVARALTTGKAATFAQGGQDPQTATAFTYKVYPNPVSTVAYVEFQSPSRSQVSVELYNSLGVREQVLFQNTVEANQSYKLTLGPGGLGAGIHYCMIRVDGKVYTSKVLVMPGH
ncbi:T9SS type A sorting domain-containing protein [Puia dinghuensis]|uniref:T9SS type A sorting domain-containing protein n=1 Tax=Puia dinghuensis TaxID=1792502 RepID=UPI00166E19B1|nr:T9SS type A sorting domain-containing protein [Puia dinghuensis]